ncbi:MAG: NADH-quinone oxidoreductase subunit K [Phycisphaerae bacterium]|jgi:hydrogenase-4 component E
MQTALDILSVLLVLANLRLLGSSRLSACIQTVAIQAVLLGTTAILANASHLDVRLVAIVLVSTALKAGVLPWLLRRALRESEANKEVQPFIGFTPSLLAGAGLLGVCFFIAAPLQSDVIGSSLLIPVSLFTVVAGLLVIVSRRKAITQVVGYLAMENGIYAFGMAFAIQEPLLVEMGVLLDVLVAVFVMGIIIYHISREFDHMDTDRLAELKD